METKQFNILLYSFAFMLIFTAFQTHSGISQRVLNSYINETKNTDHEFKQINGYISFAVLYTAFAIFNWVAPIIISLLSAKYSLILGALTYVIYIFAMLYPNTIILYLLSILLGIGAAITWTAQGVYHAENSSESTIQKNSGTFWAMLQSAIIWGNLYIYFAWYGVETITSPMRIQLYTILGISATVGVSLFLGLKPVNDEKPKIEDETSSTIKQSKKVFLEAVKLFPETNMLIIYITFFYTGFHQTFWTGVYSTCIANTKAFGTDSDRLMGINGITMGLGQVFGGLFLTIFPDYINKRTKSWQILWFGGILHLTSFVLIYLNFDPMAPIEKNDGLNSILFGKSNYPLTVLIAFFLGLGDCCFNTQVYSYLGTAYKKNSAPAFAIFKSLQSIACAIAFSYSNFVMLPYQLSVLAIFCVASCYSYYVLDSMVQAEKDVMSDEHEKLKEEELMNLPISVASRDEI